MKTAKIYGPKEVRVDTVPDPIIQNDEILIKVMACGICGSDLHVYKSGAISKFKKPMIMGHEFSGHIIEVGSQVKGCNVGDKVLGNGYRTCGSCYWCKKGVRGRCADIVVPGWGLDGAFAEYVKVPNPIPGKSLFIIPESLNWKDATTIEPLSVSCFCVQRANIKPEDIVIVMGAGMIGQGIVQAAKAGGASKIIVCEPSSKRLDIAERLGADLGINPGKTDPVRVIEEFTSREMATVVFECSGVSKAFQQALTLLRPMGRMLQVGVFERDLGLTPEMINLLAFKNLTVQGCAGANWPMALELVQRGQVKTSELITHTFPLEMAKEAVEMQSNTEESVKVVITP